MHGRTQFSVAEIARDLGYSTTANFSRAFKRWTGKSPRQYRKDTQELD
ncbi:MAG: helix-turn-helix transcriptional regulator [bacterium]|nr:helix-turn-helix transcriptional regulator [bacterium]